MKVENNSQSRLSNIVYRLGAGNAEVSQQAVDHNEINIDIEKNQKNFMSSNFTENVTDKEK